MLSGLSRMLTYATAVLYGITGLVLFVLPESMSANFAWKVTPFMTMTIGAWCLGNAWLAWISARRWRWSLVYTALVYLWLFGVAEAAVLLAFHDKLRLGHPVAWLYIAAVLANVVTAVVGVIDWRRSRPRSEAASPAVGRAIRVSALAFFLFVAFLATYGIFARVGAPGTNAGIFPEVMPPFTLRAFAAFYLSLSLGALLLLRENQLNTYLHHGFASFGLIITITVAALVYLRLFDFVHRPGGLAYIGAYLVVGIPLLLVLVRLGTGSAVPPRH